MMEPSELLSQLLQSAAVGQFDMVEHDLCKAYYDGYQETEELAAIRAQLHKPTQSPNIFFKYMNTVAGMEEQQRVDIMVAADDDGEEDEAVAEALNKLMAETTRLHDVNSVTAEAWVPQANAGLAWVYWGRNTDVLGLPFDCHHVPESEIIWDRRCVRRDLSDCGYIARRRFLRKNEALGVFPEHKELIERTYTSFNDWGPISQKLGGSYAGSEGLSDYSEHLIRDDQTKTVAIFDVFYRAYEKRDVLFFKDGRRAIYDKENPAHVKAKLVEGIPVENMHVKVMRNAWFLGPYLISDELSPHPHDMYPYVLFRGFQEEKTKALFALGRSMITPQDDYNAAHIQQKYLMEKVTVMVKKGALMGTRNENLEDVQIEAHRADGIMELNNMEDVKIVHHYEQIDHLGTMKRDAEYAMESASGISNALTGAHDQNKSGVAQSQQVEQATVTLSSLFANYYFGRMMLGRLIVAHLIDDIGMSEQRVSIKSQTGDVLKQIDLNAPGEDGQITNSVSLARTRIVLDDIESSRGYRAQNMLMLKDITPNADERLKPYLTIAALKLSNLPERHELIADMQKMVGKGATEDQQVEMDEAANQQAQEMADLEKREREAEINLNDAKAEEARAKAQAALNPPVAEAPPVEDAANDPDAMNRKKAKVSQIREALAKKALG